MMKKTDIKREPVYGAQKPWDPYTQFQLDWVQPNWKLPIERPDMITLHLES